MSRLLPSPFSNRFTAVIFWLVCCLLTTSAGAESSDVGVSEREQHQDHFLDQINWHGFISQGFALTDDNNFLGSSSDGSFKFDEAGLNASWRALNQLQFSAQVLYKQIGNSEPKGTQLDFAIADWRAIDTFDVGVGLRLGRLKNPYGFYNETRDVAATRLGILLPESIYVDYLREVLHSSDSIGVYGHKEFSTGTLSFNTVFGKPILNDQITSVLINSLPGLPTKGDIRNERAVASQLSFEDGSGKWRSAFSYIKFGGDFQPGAGEIYSPGSVETEQYMLSVELNWENWQLVSEYQLRNIKNRKILGSTINTDGVSHYWQLGYRFSPVLKGYFRHDVAYLNKNDKSGEKQQLSTGGAFIARDAFAKDYTAGLSYQPSFEWSFGLEVHHINGTFWLPDLENPDVINQKQRWNMLLLHAAYRF